jgi:hypothetical protein
MLHCAQAGQREGGRVQREGGGHQEGHRESNALTGPRMTGQFHPPNSDPDDEPVSSPSSGLG